MIVNPVDVDVHTS